MHLRSVYSMAALFAVAYSCQDPWTIESPMLKRGALINFKNSSTVGQGEDLRWTWIGPQGEIWDNRIWFYSSGNEMGGSFLFKERMKHHKNTVFLEWSKKGNETKWSYDSGTIKQQGWRIVVRDVIEVNFIPLEKDWVFKVGEDQLFGPGMESYNEGEEEEEDYDEEEVDDAFEKEEGEVEIKIRKRRSPQFNIGSEAPTEAGFGEWMRSIWGYFFGDGNVARGESEGVFTRLGKWLREVSCSVGGPCDQPQPGDPPTGPFPAPTMPAMPAVPTDMPTLSPDVEIIPELNDVKK